MEQAQSLQDLINSVTLSSSPSASAGLQETPTEDSCGSLSVSSSGPDATLADSKIQSTIHQGTRRREDNQPLLSPFAVVNNAPLLVSEDTGVQSTVLQHSMDTFPSSPGVPQISPDSSSSVLQIVPDVLQSPFGVNPKTSFLSNDLSLSSSPENCSSVPNTSNVNASDTGRNGNLKKDETKKGSNDSSDSGEGTVDAPLTPKALRAPGIASSFPHSVVESVEEPLEEIICADVIQSDHHFEDPTGDRGLSHKLLQLSWSPPVISRESSSIIAVHCPSKSANPESLVAITVNEHSTSKDPSITRLPGAIRQSPVGKNCLQRPFEANEEEIIPVPKRMTLASQQRQHKKLASPFRSPLLSRQNAGDTNTLSSSPSTPSLANAGKPSTLPKNSPHLASIGQYPRTPLTSSAKAKLQFKSPLMVSSSSSSSSRVPNTRTIQELERKVQLLKRAVKIKKEGEEEKLEQLVKKWRAVGREAAWELWQIVRDNDEASEAPYPGTNAKSSAGSFSSGWGWADASGSAQAGSWGWDKPNEQELHEDDAGSMELESPTKLEQELFNNLRNKSRVPRTSMLPPTPRGAYFEQRDVSPDYDRLAEASGLDENKTPQAGVHGASQPKSLGTVLHQLGIAHETLGWIEDEGDFVDS